MEFFIDDVLIIFPYPYVYPEQLDYMVTLKRGLDSGGHMVLEMPSGTGKTACLLSLLLAYNHHFSEDRRKVFYCTRTVAEMTKTVEEMKKLHQLWRDKLGDHRFVGICLTSRKNLCLEPSVNSLRIGAEIDTACNRLTSGWGGGSCAFFSGYQKATGPLPNGVHNVDDLRRLGHVQTTCPYFSARRALADADVVVLSFSYVADPRVHGVIKEHTNSRTIIVMDEGHNVDDVCIEAMSMVVTKRDVAVAKDKNIADLSAAIDHMKATNRERLEAEYNNLVNGLALVQMTSQAERSLALPPHIVNEAIPAAIRQSGLFLGLLQKLASFLDRIIQRTTRTHIADPLTFLARLREECSVDVRHLQFATRRLNLLLSTLRIHDPHRFRQIIHITELFETLLIHYSDDRHALPGFVVICEPNDPTNPLVHDPVVRLACVDPSLAIREIFERHRSVILTSGTLSPLDIYPKLLGFRPTTSQSFKMTLSRRCILPTIVTRSSDQAELLTEDLSSSFQTRLDAGAQQAVVAAYGALLIRLASVVPDGMVVFFTGYQYMSEVLLAWHSSGVMQQLAERKLIFIETQGVEETATALSHFRRACDIGRGAIFMSIARGKIAEGIDFDHHYGRAVVMFGVPFLPPTDEPLKQRMRWMERCLNISEAEYRNFDAMRQASQCIGRVFRNKTDYGMMVLVDRRFALADKRTKLPGWVQQHIGQHTNVSVEGAVGLAKGFFRSMAQPWDMIRGLGTTLFDRATLQRMGFLDSKPPMLAAAPEPATDAPADGPAAPDPAEKDVVAVAPPTKKLRSR